MASAWQEMTAEQQRIAIDATRLYGHLRELGGDIRALRGGLRWKTVKGRQYLVRSIDRDGHVRSLGPRSHATESIYREFTAKKRDLKIRLNATTEELRRRAKFCVAAGINRVPTLSANIVRVLDAAGLIGSHIFVIGSHALYAYEAAAGVQIKAGLLQTDDLDTLLDTSSGLEIADKTQARGFLGLLRTADRTFAPATRRSFRAINAKGFVVDLIRPPTEGASPNSLPSIGLSRDLVAEPVAGLQWLARGPKMEQIVIAGDGFPARFVVPDPRVFALHKLWISIRPDRSPLKRKRDFRQGEAVAQLAIQYLNLAFDDPALRSLPSDLTEAIPGLLSRLESRGKSRPRRLPPGFVADSDHEDAL